MMIDLAQLLKWDFWFQVRWNPIQPKTAALMLAVFVGLAAAGVALWFLPRGIKGVDAPLRRALHRGGTVCLTCGLLGVFFTFTAYQQAGILAGRFWFLFLFLLFIGWGGWTAWRAHILVPAEREVSALRKKLEKYLPKKKK